MKRRLLDRRDYIILAIVFVCWLVAMALWPRVANAQNFPGTFQIGNDTIEIEAVGNAEALVIYRNHVSQASGQGVSTVSVEVSGSVIVVDVNIIVNGDGNAEVAQVMPRGGYISIPDQLAVIDGEHGEFRVMLPMY